LIVDKDNLIIEKDYIQQQLNKLSQVPGLSDIIGSSVKTLKPKESAEVNFDEITESVLISERNELQQKLNNLEKSIEYSVAEKVVIEREKLVEAHEQLNKLSESLSREIVKNSILESEKNKLIQDLDDARNWKTIYESNHGLQEMARYQKRLKSDNHRLSVAVDQLNSKLGSAIDNINILSQAYKKLKSDCGKSDNFEFDVSVLNQDYLSDNMKLQSQIKVLESQISSLETDCGKLRQTIKDQIGSFTQEGFLYYGMTAEQLVLINEFAKNLREGLLNLPLNDKSSELLKQNKLLTDELQIYKIKLEKYEREFFGIRLSDDEYLRNNSEVENLRKDMMKLAHENSELNLKILTLTSEISQNFKKPGEHPIFLSNTHQSSLTHLSSLPLKQPKTKLGQELLQIELLKLNLPSEEWVGDVKKVYGQLIECIEQLYEKDQEIVQQQSVIETIEKSLMSMKQHMATLYYDYSLKYETWETREKQYKQELSELINDRDDQKMRLKRISDVIEIIQNDDKDSIAIKLTEVNRKLVIYEVNESILSRKYMSMNEQYETERSLRIKLEQDFIDMETALKKRILYLEDFKSSVGMRIELLLTQLDKMVPIVSFYLDTNIYPS
jgi:chromosome segregation ATPase